MSIATRTGDEGTTALMFGRRVRKDDPRVEAYGTVDELNAALGLARAHLQAANEKGAASLGEIQKQLVPLMGRLAVAGEDLARYDANERYEKLEEAALAFLDRLVTELESGEPTFDHWATPGGNLPAAALDVARTICRRAERRVVALPGDNGLAIRYLNRLSDVLWLMARHAENAR